MKTFTTIMIVVLLSLCHYVDRLSPIQEESLPRESSIKAVAPLEYQEIEINALRNDTVYYTQRDIRRIGIYNTMN